MSALPDGKPLFAEWLPAPAVAAVAAKRASKAAAASAAAGAASQYRDVPVPGGLALAWPDADAEQYLHVAHIPFVVPGAAAAGAAGGNPSRRRHENHSR